jgi:hypothetical protein
MKNDKITDKAVNKMRKVMCIRLACCIGLFSYALVMAMPGQAQSLVWSNTLEAARASAISQGKLILLVGGTTGCPFCIYMENTVCEAANVRSVIDEIFVPWNANMDLYTDYVPYASGLGSYTLPLVCMIDPKTTNAWLLRLTGPYAAGTFEGYLRLAARLAPPQASNLVSQQVIDDSHYQVRGHIWTNTQPTGVFYRVNLSTNMVNAFTSATGTTDWTAPLAPHVVAGVSNQYTFDVYARFANGSTSGTNSVVFGYRPATAPNPRFCIIAVSDGVVHLTLTNLTAEVTNRVERCLDPGQTSCWITVTNFVSTGSRFEIAERVSPSWGGAFYRVSRPP